MKLDNKVAEFCRKLDLAARTPYSLDSLLQFLRLSVFECLENEFWMSLNNQRSLRPNLISFPFPAELKKETIFSFPKSNAAALSFCQKRSIGLGRLVCSGFACFVYFCHFCPFLTYLGSFLP